MTFKLADSPVAKEARAAAKYQLKFYNEMMAAKVERKSSPTVGMSLAQRILHVGGRNNAAGYVEFGSIQAIEALIYQVLRDLPDKHPQQESNPWKTAIDEALITACLDCTSDDETPERALARLIQWEIDIALDPKVSPEARALAMLDDEPYGTVTTHARTGQYAFFKHPNPPYLDNAKSCVTVYTRD